MDNETTTTDPGAWDIHDIDGLWQRAIVVSDGIDVLEVHPLERMKTPVLKDCDLIGIGSVPNGMPPVIHHKLPPSQA